MNVERLTASLGFACRSRRLAVATPWQAPDEAWDQLRLLVALLTLDPVMFAYVSGGNRGGKSWVALVWLACKMLGHADPDVAALLERLCLPRDVLPAKGGTVYLTALSSSDSVRLHRAEESPGAFHHLLRPGSFKWYNQNSKGESRLTMLTKGGGACYFKSVDQGESAFGGSSIRAGLFDEEPWTFDGKRCVEECRMRVADQGGQVVISGTPQNGPSWVSRDYIDAQRPDFFYVQMDPLANPHLPPEFANIYKYMSKAEIEMRRFGNYNVPEGIVWSGFSRQLHVIEPFDIPADWVRWRAADFGISNPCAVLMAAQEPGGPMHVYGGMYRRGLSYADAAGEIIAMSGGSTFRDGWADPTNPAAIEYWATFGLRFRPCAVEVRVGISMVQDRLRVDDYGRPGIVFHNVPGLHPMFEEIEGYRWRPETKIGELEQVVKKRDHFCDTLRYFVSGVDAKTRLVYS